MPIFTSNITAIITIIILLAIGLLIGWIIAKFKINREWEERIPELRKDAIDRSRANLGGKFSESLSPYLPDFPYNPTELRWMGGSPVDYIVFKGMDKDQIEDIIFLEIKSGKSQLTPREKEIKELVEKKKVSWGMYRVPEAVTRIKE